MARLKPVFCPTETAFFFKPFIDLAFVVRPLLGERFIKQVLGFHDLAPLERFAELLV